MNNDLQQRWRQGRVPFSGFTILFDTEELLSLSAVCQALLAVVPILQERWSQAELFVLNDWHEHDGYVNAEQPTSWPEIFQMIEEDEAVKKFSTGEWEVRRAFSRMTTASTYEFMLPQSTIMTGRSGAENSTSPVHRNSHRNLQILWLQQVGRLSLKWKQRHILISVTAGN